MIRAHAACVMNQKRAIYKSSISQKLKKKRESYDWRIHSYNVLSGVALVNLNWRERVMTDIKYRSLTFLRESWRRLNYFKKPEKKMTLNICSRLFLIDIHVLLHLFTYFLDFCSHIECYLMLINSKNTYLTYALRRKSNLTEKYITNCQRIEIYYWFVSNSLSRSLIFFSQFVTFLASDLKLLVSAVSIC